MRQKMMDHRVRPDCVQCHQLMDPIGFALETVRRHRPGAQPRRRHAGRSRRPGSSTARRSTARAGVRQWLATSYSRQFVAVAAEKLLTYGLGRGLDYRDMPLVRALARDGGQQRQPLLGARARRRQEPAVPDEYAGRCRRPRRRPRRRTTPNPGKRTGPEGICHVHHQEAHPAAHVPAGRRRHAGAAAAGCDGARRGQLLAQTAANPKTRFVGVFYPARHGAGSLGARGRRRASREAALHPGVAREGEGPDDGAERPVVAVGRAARGHHRVRPLGGGRVPDRHQAAEDRRARTPPSAARPSTR